MPLNWTALIVFIFFFAIVSFVGFAAARWKRGNLDNSERSSHGFCSAAIYTRPIPSSRCRLSLSAQELWHFLQSLTPS
jgi:hypothetical protein